MIQNGRLAFLQLSYAAVLSTLAFAATPVKISIGNNAPLEYRDELGNPKGFSVDVIREAARRANIPIEGCLPSCQHWQVMPRCVPAPSIRS